MTRLIMRKRLGITTLLAILTSLCPPALGRGTGQPQWSKDLTKYGYSTEHPYTYTAVAASSGNVAVALNRSQDINATPSRPAAFSASNWTLSLLVFSATNGELRTTCGPWSGGMLFNLWSTSDGNFLLYQQAQQASPEHGGRVLLLSPSCQALKEVELSGPGKGGGSEFLISPSQRTFLITQDSGLGGQYELADADTLLERFKLALGFDDPRIVAVSDDGLLGSKSPQSDHSKSAAATFFYFDFHTQKWSEIPSPNGADTTEFLSNSAFLQSATTGGTDAWAASGIRILIHTTGGTPAFSTIVSRKNTHISLGSPFAVSPTGNYFGAVLNSYSVAPLWRFLDMSSGHDYVYIWSLGSAKPIARISVRSSTQHQQLAFAPDDSWFALLNGEAVMVRRLPS